MTKTRAKSFLATSINKRIPYEILLGAILIAATLFLPYVGYTYKSKPYVLSGLTLLTGKTICSGKVVLSPSLPVIVMVLAIIACLVAVYLGYRKNEKLAYGIAAPATLATVVLQIYFAGTIEKQMGVAKNVCVSYGSLICLIAAFLLTLWGMYRLKQLKVLHTLDFMAIPGMMYFIINNYIPMFGIMIAFKNMDYAKGILASPWVGLENFRQLFASNTGFFESVAWRITRNTLLYNLAFIVLGNIVGVIVGICLADIFSRKLRKFFQTGILLPQLISYVIVSYIVWGFFSSENGFINHFFHTNINFYAEPKYWPYTLIFVNLWKMTGYNAIIYLSSIVGIDRTIYESASIDGCNKWQQVRNITLPQLKPTIVTLVMLSIGRIMYSDFGLFYQVTRDSGALYNVADTIDTYVYRCLMTLNNISTSSAACTYQAVIGFILVLVVNGIVRHKNKESALF